MLGTAAWIAVVVLATADRPTANQRQEYAETLRSAAKVHNENRARLRTWQGQVEIRGRAEVKASQTKFSFECSTDFAYDRDRPALLWLNRIRDESVFTDGEWKPGDLRLRGGLIMDDRFVAVDLPADATRPPDPGSQRLGRSAVIQEVGRASFGSVTMDFDPTFFFKANGNDVGEYFAHLADILTSDQPTDGISVVRDDSRVTLVCDSPVVLNKYTVDLGRGGGLVEYFGENRPPGGAPGDDKVSANWKIELSEHAGVWVPSRVTLRDTNGADRPSYFRELVWTKSEVNDDLPASAFDLHTLGLADGDSIYDARTQTHLRVGPPEPPTPVAPVAAESGQHRHRLMWVNVGALALILVVVFLWNQRRRNGPKS